MKKFILSIFLLSLVISSYGQITNILCDFIESPYDQSNNPLTFQVSDSNPFGNNTGTQIVYDDFEIDEDTGVDAICMVGRFIDATSAGRENIGTRDANCTPGALTLSYYEDNMDTPGDLIMSFDVTPALGAPYSLGNFNVCSITLEHSTVNLPIGKYWFSVNSGELGFCDLELVYDDGSLFIRDNNNSRAITPGFLVQDFFGVFISEGMGDGINFSLRAAPLAPIPTLGEWGIIILGLSLSVFGIIWMRKERKVLA